MLAFAAIPMTCWLCALLAIPQPPRANDEMQEFVYRRLVGRQHLLIACAIVATLLVALILFSAVGSPALRSSP